MSEVERMGPTALRHLLEGNLDLARDAVSGLTSADIASLAVALDHLSEIVDAAWAAAAPGRITADLDDLIRFMGTRYAVEGGGLVDG